MALYLVLVIGVALTVIAFPGFLIIFSIKKAAESEEARVKRAVNNQAQFNIKV